MSPLNKRLRPSAHVSDTKEPANPIQKMCQGQFLNVAAHADGSYVFIPVPTSDRVSTMGVTRPPTSAAGSRATC
jgi:hypothetical protein